LTLRFENGVVLFSPFLVYGLSFGRGVQMRSLALAGPCRRVGKAIEIAFIPIKNFSIADDNRDDDFC
jgi:hypothetical protein